MTDRVLVIVIDSLGVGALPDAAEYGDEGSNTLFNLAGAVSGISLPYLERLGLGKICPFPGHDPSVEPVGGYGRMAELSRGKDSTVGHWELMGVITSTPFPTYPNGFPQEILDLFTAAIGTPILGNVAASGTEIIEQLGEEHVRTGYPIIYTSVDSVFQVAAHEEVIPVERLYQICQIARNILKGPQAVGRVIARPFIGTKGKWQRTARRRDFSVPPPEPTLLDFIKNKGIPVIGIGKVVDIFAGRGFSQYLPARGNIEIVQKIEEVLASSVKRGFIFANLVDFDMIYGHRNDPKGYAEALYYFDTRLKEILSLVTERDLLMIVGDHGCDPTTPSTDHSREYTPVLVYAPGMDKGVDLGIRASFADVAQTIARIFNIIELKEGSSFLEELQLNRRS